MRGQRNFIFFVFKAACQNGVLRQKFDDFQLGALISFSFHLKHLPFRSVRLIGVGAVRDRAFLTADGHSTAEASEPPADGVGSVSALCRHDLCNRIGDRDIAAG